MSLTVETSAAIETRAGRVHVSRAGGGSRMLLAVTPIGEPWMSAAMPAGLGDLFTIHLMELPGTGRSELRGGPASVQVMVEAIADVAEALEARPVLFGHSMNGTLTMAAANATSCAGVIAVTPPPRLPPDPAAAAAYWESHADDERRGRARELVAAHEASTDDTERSSLQERFDRLRRWHDLDFDPADLDRLEEHDLGWVRSVFESGKDVDWRASISSVAVPILLALGQSDFVAPPTAWTGDITPPQASVHVFTRSGHTPYLEEADEFLQVTARWLAGVS